MAEVVLDELERGPGVEQVRRDRVAKRVRRQARRQPGQLPVADEPRLDLAAPERPEASGEQRLARPAGGPGQMSAKQGGRALEEDLLAPCATLQAPDEESSAIEADVGAREQEHLAHPQPVVVHEREEHAIPGIGDGLEEALDLVLGQVAGQTLVRQWADGHGGEDGQRRQDRTAPFSRKAQSVANSRREPGGTGSNQRIGQVAPSLPDSLRGGSTQAKTGDFVARSLRVRGPARTRT